MVLDVGETNGVIKGTVFQVTRHANAEHPLSIATIRVTSLEPFSAKADIEDTAKDLTIAPGDSAVEQTDDLALN